MDIKDIIKNNLRYAVWVCGGVEALDERSSAGSAKYFEQVIAGFQGKKDKAPRSLGPAVAAAVAEAIGMEKTWMYQEHPDLWSSIPSIQVDAPSRATNAESMVVMNMPTARAAKIRRDERINEIVDLLRKTNIEGLAVMLDRAKDAAKDYPIAKQTPASSA